MHKFIVVQHGAHAAPEEGVDKLARTLPLEVRIVELIISVKQMEVVG